MALLPLLLAGHLIGDWIVQTDWEAANKTIEDPHPGRCVNHRAGPNGTQLRCLDYDGHNSKCTFPNPAPSPSAAYFQQFWTGDTKPLPWVSPLGKGVSGGA